MGGARRRTPTGSRSPGRGSSPTAAGRSTRPGWTSTTGWSTRCWSAGIAAGADAVPLGPAAGAGGRGRLAEPGHRRPVRRVRGDRGRRGSPTGCRMWITLNEPFVLTLLGLRARRARARPAAALRRAAGRPPPAARPRPGRAGAARGGRAEHRRSPTSHAPTLAGRATVAEDDARRPSCYDILHNRLFADPSCSGATRTGAARRCMPRAGRRATSTSSRTPLDWFGINYYNPTLSAPPGRGAAPADATGSAAGRDCRSSPGDRGLPDAPTSAGRSCRTALRELLVGAARPVRRPAAADLHHRERLLLRRRAGVE